MTMATTTAVRDEVRALEERLTADQADALCLAQVCDHDHDPIVLPPGVRAVCGSDWSGPSRGRRSRVVLVRFTRRAWGGWMVVRADNGRHLGWLVHQRAAGWSCHIAVQAFCGDGLDDTGDLLDQVDPTLHAGDPNNTLVSRSIGYTRTREDGAYEIVSHLLYRQAPAVGGPAHWGVRRWADR